MIRFISGIDTQPEYTMQAQNIVPAVFTEEGCK
jgi:hypothetical protein